MKKYIIFAVLFAMLIGTCIAANVDMGNANALKQALEKDGFTVQQGYMGYFDIIKLYNLGIVHSAYGNNPSTRYLQYFVPPAPGHKVPELFSKITRVLGMNVNSMPMLNIVRMKPLYLWEKHLRNVGISVSILM